MSLRDWLGLGSFPQFQRDDQPSPSSMIGFAPEGGIMPAGVTATTALGISAVWRCVDIISNGVSQLEWRELRGNLELPLSRLTKKPQSQRTRREWVSLVTSTLALFDVCYLLKVGEDSEGVPVSLLYVDPTLISPTTTDYATLLPADSFYIGQTIVSRDRLVILHRSPQPTITDTLTGILQIARITFAAAISAENYASRYWQAGGSPNGYLATEANLSGAAANDLSDRWRERRRQGPDYLPVMTNGLKLVETGADPTAQSAVEARREMVADVGRYFGIGASLLNSPNQSSETYSTTEAEGIHLVRYTLQNYVNAIEDAISEQLPGGRYMEMVTAPLLSGTNLAQAQAFQLATGGQAWMSPQDVRDIMKLPPIEPDVLNPPAPAPAPQPAADMQQQGDMAQMSGSK